MAQKINVELIDDLDGAPAAETVTFGLDGATYEIDLSERNAAALRSALASYVSKARRVSGRRKGRASAGGSDAKAIREWARATGKSVPTRGRIPADVKAAYDAAH